MTLKTYDARLDLDHENRMHQDRHNEEEVYVGNEALHAAEEENGMIEDELNGTDEDVEPTGNDQRHLAIRFKEAEVIKFLRVVEAGDGMSVAQATDILKWGKSFNDERAHSLPKTLLTCWTIVDKVLLIMYIINTCMCVI